MNKFFEKLGDYKILIFGILGALLISMTLKTQVVIITYSDDYALRLEYSVYGRCVRASASLKAAEPAIQNELYFGNSIETSVLKAVKQLEKLDEDKNVVKIMATGIPLNNDKLEISLIELLEKENYSVELLELSK